jgi:hypothetical protein
MLFYRLFAVIVIIFVPVSGLSSKHVFRGKSDISPFEYGLKTANTGVERYSVLLKTHQAAVKSGVNVDYTGIDTIKLEIPAKPLCIPLTRYNDFKGCVIIVKNTSKNCWLFGSKEKDTPVDVSKRAIDTGDFRKVEPLKNGRYLLLIEDEKPWVMRRKGREYGHQRRDILLVENGMAKNAVTMSYNNFYSSPKCSFIKVYDEPWVMKNLTIKRDPACTVVTHIASISGYNDVRISNVTLYTPCSSLVDDRGIRIKNCTNVTLKNVRIDGTYSQPKHSGYGVNMNNIWNFRAYRMYGKANWGIFGNNNINTARIENSKINRFDIHCYGRNISFKNVDFFDLYNQYSSVYGTISYEHCTFTDFVPVLNGGSYYSYVGHDVIFNDCIFNATPPKSILIKMGNMNEAVEMRHELMTKCLPNVSIKSMTVNMKNGANELLLFRCSSGGKSLTDIGYLSNICIDGLTINSDGETAVKRVTLSNINMQTKRSVDCQMKDVTINQPHKEGVSKLVMMEPVLKTNIPIKGGKVVMRNVKNLKQ